MPSTSPYKQQRAEAISQMARESAANPIQLGPIPGWSIPGGGSGASGSDALGYLSSIYGHNTNANIAYLNALAALQQQGLANTGAADVANITGGFNLQGQQLQTDAQRYGFDVNRDIAGIQGQNQLALQNAVNSGQLGLANVQGQFGLDQQRLANDAARYGADTQFGIAGLQQQGETGRGLMDNLGADYRTGVGAQAQLAASTYAPQVRSDQFGAVLNGIAAPLFQSWFGIQPGTPYQTRDAPTLNLGSGPNYSGALASVGAGQPMSNPAAASQPAPAQSAPRPAAQPAAHVSGSTQVGRPAPPGMMSQAIGRTSPSTQQMMSGFQRNLPRGNQTASPSGPGGSPQQPAPRSAPAPAPTPAPAPQRSFTSSPQPSVTHSSQQPSTPGQAGPSSGGPGSNQPAAMQPLPSSFGGPQVTQGPVMSQGQIQAQVGRQQGSNAVQVANQKRNNERSMAARGFSSNSPQLAALNQQAGFARNFADQEAATQIPAQYAQMNAQHRLASQLGASNVFGQRTQEELARRGQQSNFQTSILGWLSGLMG